MSGSRLDLPSMLVEAKIREMMRDAEQMRLVAAANAGRERIKPLAFVQALAFRLRVAFAGMGRRRVYTGRERASRPQTRSQTMQTP